MQIIGRTAEIKELEKIYHGKGAEFIVVYGRRRVGKTFLINELFKDRITFSHTALSPIELSGKEMIKMQLQHFTYSLIKLGVDVHTEPKSWIEAFFLLEKHLELLDCNQRILLFFDELPWLDTARSGFITAFEAFWNGWGAQRDNVMLIACGSAVSWISDNLVNGKGGLYNRVTNEIKLNPFSLHECEEFFRSKNIMLDRYDILQAYMILGGIPYYLNLFSPDKSLAQNIDSLIFNEKGKLSNEYNRLFSAIFSNPEKTERIVSLLASKRIGFTRSEILEHTKEGDGGGFSKLLRALEESDFISSNVGYGEPAKKTRYRLTDNFCLFYNKFASKIKKNDPNFWQHNLNSPSITAWRGLAFENICFQHIAQIKQALGINGVHTETYSWSGEGGQIDMLIKRADRLINICECKYSSKEFVIDKEYDAKLRERQSAFIEEAQVKYPTIMTLITTFGLKLNEHHSRIQSVITADDLFRY